MPSSAAHIHDCLRHCAPAIGTQTGLPGKHSLAVATLVSWLLTEVFGAYMLTSWLTGQENRARRKNPDSVPRSVIFGHAALAFTGLVWWISFVVTGIATLAWISVAFLAPAVGLGISTLTLWTPYPARLPDSESDQARFDGKLGITNDEMLARALADEALTTRLVDDLVADVLARPGPAFRRPRIRISPLVPAVHGLLAIGTMLLAMFAAVTAL